MFHWFNSTNRVARVSVALFLVSHPLSVLAEPQISDLAVHDPWIPAQHRAHFAEMSDEYHQYDVTLNTLDLTVDPVGGTIAGEAALDFFATGDLNSLIVDAVDMKILDVKMGDGSTPFYEYDGNILTVTLPVPMMDGMSDKVRIRYEASRSQSLFLAGPDQTRPARVQQAYTYTQPDGTRAWYPSHDIPGDKSQVHLTLKVPSSFAAVSNGDGNGPRRLPDGRWVYQFDSKFNMATYLTSLVIGHLKTESIGNFRGVPLTITAPAYLMDKMRVDTSRTAQMMQVFEEFTQVKFPFQKYQQSVAEMYRASMEHQTATTMGGNRITGDWSGEPVVAHELAHQWFGDLVTCGVWGDMWLNEGFASYLPLVFYERVGDGARVAKMAQGYRDSYFAQVDGAPQFARAISTDEEFPNYDIFDSTSYSKGALIIQLMRNWADRFVPQSVGTNAFSRALGIYLGSHSYGNVRYSDLQTALEASTGYSWAQFFKEWIRQPGHPEVSAAWTQDQGGVALSIRQEQALRTQNTWGKFTFPLEILAIEESGARWRQMVWVTDKEQVFDLPLAGKIVALVLDPEHIVPGRFTVNQPATSWPFAYGNATSPIARQDILAKWLSKANQLVTPEMRSILAVEMDPWVLSEIARLTRTIPAYEQLTRDAVLSLDLMHNLPGFLMAEKALAEKELMQRAIPTARPSFEDLARRWSSSRWSEEREVVIEMMYLADPLQSQTFAEERLEEAFWCDRDRLALVRVLTSSLTTVNSEFIRELIAHPPGWMIATDTLPRLASLGYNDSFSFDAIKAQAVGHRSTRYREMYIDLLGLQNARSPDACLALSEIADQVARGDSVTDRSRLPVRIQLARTKLGCP